MALPRAETYCLTFAFRPTTTSCTFWNGCAVRARASAFARFGDASRFGAALKRKRWERTPSGVENHLRTAGEAWGGVRPPTGTPPIVTPSGSVRGGGGVV